MGRPFCHQLRALSPTQHRVSSPFRALGGGGGAASPSPDSCPQGTPSRRRHLPLPIVPYLAERIRFGTRVRQICTSVMATPPCEAPLTAATTNIQVRRLLPLLES